MKLIKGLQTDSNEQDQPESSYIWALNWVANTKMGSLVSERGFTKIDNVLPSNMFPIGIMPTSDKVVIFSTNAIDGAGNRSEIGIYDEVTEVYTPVLNDSIVSTQLGGTVTGLNFSREHQIKSVYRFNSKNELEIAFTDWHNPPRIMFIGDTATMQFYYNNYDPNKIRIFQTALLGTVDVTIETSGSLPADTYFVFYRYKNIDQTTTDSYIHPEPQYIISDSIFEDYIDITGNDIGVTTNKSIRVNFDTVDNSFPFIEVGLYRVSTASSVIVDTIPIGQESVILTSFSGDTVLPAEILAGKVSYTKAKTITSLNDQLMIGNLENRTNLIPQKYINALNLNWTCLFIDPAKAKASKDYNKQVKSFCAGEVYSIVIRFLLSDGSYTQWQHIPGRKPRVTTHQVRFLNSSNSYGGGSYQFSAGTDFVGIGDKALIEQDPGNIHYKNYTSSDTDNSYFHTTDTCDLITSTLVPIDGYTTAFLQGSMGYWENETEQYTQYFLGEDLKIGDTPATLDDGGNTTVRHHRFPTLHFLETRSSDTLNFTRKFPQLGIKITNLDIDFLNLVLKEQAPNLTIQSYEIGFSARDFNNCTVYAQDLSLFGCYISRQRLIDPAFPPGINPVKPVYNSNISEKDAIYFTGSNSVITGIGFQSTRTRFDNAGNIQAAVNVIDDLTNFTHCPQNSANLADSTNQIPNRQRFHTPDLVDPLDPSKDPLITPSYVRHEVLMVCGDSYKTLDNGSPRKALYASEGADMNFTSDTSYALVDYCFSNINVNAAFGEDQYENFCIKNLPTRWVLRNIKGSGYVPKGTRTVVIGDNAVINALFDINTGGGDLYGGSNHFHTQLFDRYFDRPVGDQPEDYPKKTSDVMAVYGSFLTLTGYSGAYDLTADPSPGLDPNDFYFYKRHPIPSLNFSKTRSDQNGIRHHHTAFLSSLTKQTKTIYNGFTAIQVVQALKDHHTDPVELRNIFLGDCFISEVQYITHGWGNPNIADPVNNPYAGQNFTAFRFYAHTRKNLDYRFEKTTEAGIINQYYPASRFNVNVITASPPDEVKVGEIFYKETGKKADQDKTHAYQGFNYASTYGFQPIFSRVTTVHSNSSQSISLNKFPFRIHSSEKQAKESLLNNWRVFLPLNYYENDKTKGEITNLQGYDDQLLVHTIQSLFITRDRGNLQNTAAGITIGTGGLFDFPPKEAIFDNLGYTGTQHQFGCAMTKLGYVFPDAQQGKYFIYNKDSGIVELSQLGMFNYFKTYGRCKHNDYSRFPGSAPDSSVNSSGLSSWNACYDEFNNRVLIGFNRRLAEDPLSYTLSYSDSFKSFTSFHSYIPDLICNTRQNVYSFKGNVFYKHNTPNRNYYIGDPNEQQEIDIVFNTCMIPTQNGVVEAGRDYTKLWQSFNWLSQMHNYDFTDVSELETFTKASVRTDKQCSQLIDLVPFTSTRIYDSKWHFNAFRDKLNRIGPRFQSFFPFVKSLNEKFEITYPGSTTFNSRFVDNFVILRLIYTTNSTDRELHLIQVDYTNKIVKK